jgi:hypothetical protein
VPRWYGLEGLRAVVRRHVALGQDLARRSEDVRTKLQLTPHVRICGQDHKSRVRR